MNSQQQTRKKNKGRSVRAYGREIRNVGMSADSHGRGGNNAPYVAPPVQEEARNAAGPRMPTSRNNVGPPAEHCLNI